MYFALYKKNIFACFQGILTDEVNKCTLPALISQVFNDLECLYMSLIEVFENRAR